MIYDNVDNLKEKLRQIRFGILKTTGNPLLKLSKSFIIDTCTVDYNGYLWCIASDSLPAGLLGGREFAAQLKYVYKPEGLFIKVTGHATAVKADSPAAKEFLEKGNFSIVENSDLIRLKIEEVHYYLKKAISAYTSFLQAINNFTFNKPALE